MHHSSLVFYYFFAFQCDNNSCAFLKFLSGIHSSVIPYPFQLHWYSLTYFPLLLTLLSLTISITSYSWVDLFSSLIGGKGVLSPNSVLGTYFSICAIEITGCMS